MYPQSTTSPSLVPCACGCGELRPARDAERRQRRYIKGHGTRGRKASPETIARLRASHLGHQNPYKGIPRSEETCRRMSEGMKAAYAANPTRWWRTGGRTAMLTGYVLRKVPDHPFADCRGYVLEHRLVMEGILGRYLTPQERVHHIDGDPGNNTPENLKLLPSIGAHTSLHIEQRFQEKERAVKAIRMTEYAYSQLAEMRDYYSKRDGERYTLADVISWAIRDRYITYLDNKATDADIAADKLEEAMR